jgi:hypothetical protein
LDKLKLDIGPIPTFDFVNFVLGNKDANLIRDFQRKFNLKNARSLLQVFNFLPWLQFCLSKFKENAIYIIKSTKWRRDSEATVKRLVTKFSEPWFKKISRRNAQLLKRNDKTISEQMKRPVGVTNQLVILHNAVIEPQVIRSDEIEKISFGLKQSIFDCFKRSTIFDRTAAHFLKLVRSLEAGVLNPRSSCQCTSRWPKSF